MQIITVLNWDNKRATRPMAAAIKKFQASREGCKIEQVIRPLSDFEHQDIEYVAKKYDLIVYDHPFSGQIAESGCFVPLEEALRNEVGRESDTNYLGRTLESYRYGNHVWGVPIDGATQNAIYREDLLRSLGARVPRSHQQVLRLGRKARSKGLYLGTAVKTPHAFMSILAYMANLGTPVTANSKGITHFPEEGFTTAYNAVKDLLRYCTPDSFQWNSIKIHEALIMRDDVVYAPAVYGYGTYGELDRRVRLSFADFAGLVAPFASGAILGGAALGLSKYCAHPETAMEFMKYMASDEVQAGMVGVHSGQPASVSGWDNEEADEQLNGFLSCIRESMELSVIRPRFNGYPKFQQHAGTVTENGLANGDSAKKVYQAIVQFVGDMRYLQTDPA